MATEAFKELAVVVEAINGAKRHLLIEELERPVVFEFKIIKYGEDNQKPIDAQELLLSDLNNKTASILDWLINRIREMSIDITTIHVREIGYRWYASADAWTYEVLIVGTEKH